MGFVTSNTEKPDPPLPYGINRIVCQVGSSSNSPWESKPLISTSCTTGDPSTPNIALLPPSPLGPRPSNKGLIAIGNFAAINGGTNAHSSLPVDAFIACNTPLLEPA